MRRKAAFTLIELLVVIAIIAIVAAILFPVLVAAKRSPKRTVALSNLDQLGKASQLYLTDSDEHLPFHFPIQPSWPGYNEVFILAGHGFDLNYGRYLANSDVWLSPEDRLQDKGYTSFAFNEQLAFDWSMSSLPRPAEAVYVTDRTDVGNPSLPQAPPADTYIWYQFTDQRPFTEASLPGTLDPVTVATQIDPIRYVGNLGLYLFLDTHVAAMSFARTWGDASHNLHLALKS